MEKPKFVADKITMRKISELIPADYNPRYMTESDVSDLETSMDEFGIVDPAIVNMHPDRENVIVGGHQRIRVAAERRGWKTFPCVHVNLDYERERELNIRLNKNTGRWDWEKMANEFEMDALLTYGFTEKELLDHADGGGNDKRDLSGSVKSSFEVIIECDSEAEQEDIFNRLQSEGYKCRVLTL